MAMPRSELLKVMKNQNITMVDLADELDLTRQTVSRYAKAYMSGETLRNDTVRTRFDRILSEEDLNRKRNTSLDVRLQNEVGMRKARYDMSERFRALKEILGDCYPDSIEKEMPVGDSWKRDIISSAPESRRGEVSQILVALEEDFIAYRWYDGNSVENDEIEDYMAIWDDTPECDGRPIEYKDGYISSFAMLSGPSCRIVASVSDFYFEDDSDEDILVHADIYAATDRCLWIVASAKAECIAGTEVFSARFDDLIPGHRYFYKVRYEHIRSIVPDGEVAKAYPNIGSIDTIVEDVDGRPVGGETDFHPLK